ncbi:hypothetical protein D210916BOD24_26500 [Alteromonas sp. D210916BOD_24]|uniref:cellulose synthase subunit BcsC-related outer membrane protein n=1 Tax=Alteromonas sp. D210916BOD_24 TaxID=3157618 RepID=UPI00399D4E90
MVVIIRFTCTWLTVLLLCFAAEAIAQTDTVYQEKDLGLIPRFSTKLDLTGLWYHIEKRQTLLANNEYARLKALHPDWTVPKDVILALEILNNYQDMNTAALNTDTSSISVLPKEIEVFANLTPDQRRKVSQQDILRLVEKSNVLGRSDIYLLMAWTALDKALDEVALQQFSRAKETTTSDEERNSIQQGLLLIRNRMIEQAIEQSDFVLLQQYLENEDRDNVFTKIEGAAWRHYEGKNFELAYALFALQGNKEGQYLTLIAQQKYDRAFDIACALNSNIYHRYCADLLSFRQSYLYNDDKFEQSIQSAIALNTIRPLHNNEKELLGWAAKECGNTALANETFESLLIQNGNREDIATALINLNSTNPKKLEGLATQFTLIDAILKKKLAESAWGRKQFLLAYLEREPRAIVTQNKDALTAVYGTAFRSRSGEKGLGNFDVLSQYIGIGGEYERWLWNATINYEQYYSGLPTTGDWFGSEQLLLDTEPFKGISGFEDIGGRIEALYQKDSANFYLNIEYGMVDQPVSTEVTGQLSTTHFLDNLTLALTLFRKPKDDSLLSQSGTFNEAHREPWGYVLEEGGSALAAFAIAPKWSMSGTAQFSILNGEQVARNQAISFRMDVNYDFAERVSQHLDYWRIGPFASYKSYDKNLSGFTYGNGGYFSPSYFVTMGGYSELLTAEAYNWQIKLRSSLALSRVEQTNDPRFPFDSHSSETLGYSQSTGLSGNITVEGQYRLNDNWVVSGYIGKAFAVEYQAFQAGLQFRWRAGKGNGVTSDELLLSSPRVSHFVL